MSLNIGTLVGYLQLDDSNFNRKADAADKKMEGLKLHLQALSKNNPKLKIEVETRQLEELQARIVELKAQAAKGVDVRVEMVAALAKLDALQTKIRAMHNAEIKVHVDDKVALTKLAALKKASDSLGKMPTGGLFGSALAFGPALLPAINALPGGLLAVSSGAVATAGGIGVLAVAFHGLGDAVNAYQKYQAALPFAKNATQIAALKKQLALSGYGEQNTQARTFTRLVATDGSQAASGIKHAAQAGVFPGATKALHDIMPLVPVIEHLMTSLGTTVGNMTDRTAKALNSPFWRQWFHWLGQDAKTQLPLVGSIFGHFFQGIMQGIQRFSPQGTSLLHWVDDLGRKFSNWTGSPQFDHFIATTGANARLVADALKPLGKILAEMYQGMSGTGAVELQIFGHVLEGMAHLPPSVFQVIGTMLPIIFVGLKSVALTSSIVTGVRALGTAFMFLATSETMAASAGRGAIIAAGLLVVANAGERTSKSMGAVQGAIGGLATGAMVGTMLEPGVGTAIGAGIGLIAGGLYGFVKAGKKAADTAVSAAPPMQRYMSVIEAGAKAVRDYNEQTAVKNLTDSGALKAAQSLGIAQHTVVAATLGNMAAQRQIDAVLARVTGTMTDLTVSVDQFGGITMNLTKAQMDAGSAATTLAGALGIQHDALRKDIIAANDAALAMGKYKKVLPGIPTRVATRIDTLGLEKADAAIVRLTKRYHLTPTMVKTILTAAGEKPTMAAINRIIAAAKNLGKPAKPITPKVEDKPATTGLSSLLGGLVTTIKNHSPMIVPKVKSGNATSDLLGMLSGLQATANNNPITIRTKRGKAAGGTVGGMAAGGTVAGQRTPYGDKVLTPTAPGEEIISNDRGQADMNRSALKAANAGAIIAVVSGGFAGGGTVPPDPLTGYTPSSGSGPSTGGSSTHHHGKKKHHGQTRDQKLHAQLTAENKALSQTKSMLAAAQEWSSAFGGNVFAENLPTTKTVPGAVTTSIINGMKVTQSAASTTKALTPQEILTSMLAYQHGQQAQAKSLSGWVAKLRKEGVSKAVLDQMKAGGPQGIAEIQALASGSVAQVREFNASQAATTSLLNNTGSLATTGHPYSDLQKDQMTEQKQIRLLNLALHHKPIPVRVSSGNLRP